MIIYPQVIFGTYIIKIINLETDIYCLKLSLKISKRNWNSTSSLSSDFLSTTMAASAAPLLSAESRRRRVPWRNCFSWCPAPNSFNPLPNRQSLSRLSRLPCCSISSQWNTRQKTHPISAGSQVQHVALPSPLFQDVWLLSACYFIERHQSARSSARL